MFDNTAAVVTDRHNRGKKVICYIDVGSWENYRSDASKFPASLLGAKYNSFLAGYPEYHYNLTPQATSHRSLLTGQS